MYNGSNFYWKWKKDIESFKFRSEIWDIITKNGNIFENIDKKKYPFVWFLIEEELWTKKSIEEFKNLLMKATVVNETLLEGKIELQQLLQKLVDLEYYSKNYRDPKGWAFRKNRIELLTSFDFQESLWALERQKLQVIIKQKFINLVARQELYYKIDLFKNIFYNYELGVNDNFYQMLLFFDDVEDSLLKLHIYNKKIENIHEYLYFLEKKLQDKLNLEVYTTLMEGFGISNIYWEDKMQLLIKSISDIDVYIGDFWSNADVLNILEKNFKNHEIKIKIVNDFLKKMPNIVILRDIDKLNLFFMLIKDIFMYFRLEYLAFSDHWYVSALDAENKFYICEKISSFSFYNEIIICEKIELNGEIYYKGLYSIKENILIINNQALELNINKIVLKELKYQKNCENCELIQNSKYMKSITVNLEDYIKYIKRFDEIIKLNLDFNMDIDLWFIVKKYLELYDEQNYNVKNYNIERELKFFKDLEKEWLYHKLEVFYNRICESAYIGVFGSLTMEEFRVFYKDFFVYSFGERALTNDFFRSFLEISKKIWDDEHEAKIKLFVRIQKRFLVFGMSDEFFENICKTGKSIKDADLDKNMSRTDFYLKILKEINTKNIKNLNKFKDIMKFNNIWEVYSYLDEKGGIIKKYPKKVSGTKAYYVNNELFYSTEGFRFILSKMTGNESTVEDLDKIIKEWYEYDIKTTKRRKEFKENNEIILRNIRKEKLEDWIIRKNKELKIKK